MSGGCGGKEIANPSSKSSDNGDGVDFGRQISKIAVAQICDQVGFHGAQRSAIDTLADIAIKFVSELGKTAHFYAELSGRTSCNEFDIIQGLEDLGSSQVSRTDAHHCVIGSGVVRDITQFVGLQEGIPFARSIPSFPIVRRSDSQTPSFAQIGEEPPRKNIPEWLPAFPDPHTYVHTPVWNERASDGRADKIEQARQRRKAERSLLSLEKRLVCNGGAGFVQALNGNDVKGKKVVGSNNPFLAPPLPAGEKDVPDIVVPSEAGDQKRVSVLETFEPIIEAAKAGSLDCETEESRGFPKRRPTVRFKFAVDKNKSLALPLTSKVVGAKSDSWFLRDDEKDDKKRRAEMILKQAMENPHELTQM